MTSSRRLPATLAPLLALALAGAAVAAPSGSVREDFLRGMVVSCPRYGAIWGSPAMGESLDELGRLGVEWVSIHPYARIDRDGTVHFRPAAETGYLERAVTMARKRGLGMFWKPHLAYWGSFGWRGEIEFEDPAARRRFFDGYSAFILDQARFAELHGVELLAVGVELEGTTRHEEEWRRILDGVRAVYRGRITYAANWDRLEAVPFWEALDLVGVHAYFPLAAEDDPSREAIWAAWDRPLAELARLSRRLGGKRVLFAEIGYNGSPDAAREPWAHRRDATPESRALRARLIDVALERIEREPVVAGMFWWKWMPGEAWHQRDFSMQAPEALDALTRRWGAVRSPITGGAP